MVSNAPAYVPTPCLQVQVQDWPRQSNTSPQFPNTQMSGFLHAVSMGNHWITPKIQNCAHLVHSSCKQSGLLRGDGTVPAACPFSHPWGPALCRPLPASRHLTWAFHVHEVGIGALHQALLLVFPLLLLRRGMKEILSELREAERQGFRNQRRKRGDRKQRPPPHTGESSPRAAPGVCAAGPPSYLSAPVYAGAPRALQLTS